MRRGPSLLLVLLFALATIKSNRANEWIQFDPWAAASAKQVRGSCLGASGRLPINVNPVSFSNAGRNARRDRAGTAQRLENGGVFDRLLYRC